MDGNLFQLAFINYLMLLSVVSAAVNAVIIWQTRHKQG